MAVLKWIFRQMKILFAKWKEIKYKYIQTTHEQHFITTNHWHCVIKWLFYNVVSVLELDIVEKNRTGVYGFVIPQQFVHHKFTELEQQLQNIADEYPRITHLYSVGTSVKGRRLYVLEISDKPGVHEPGQSITAKLWSSG